MTLWSCDDAVDSGRRRRRCRLLDRPRGGGGRPRACRPQRHLPRHQEQPRRHLHDDRDRTTTARALHRRGLRGSEQWYRKYRYRSVHDHWRHRHVLVSVPPSPAYVQGRPPYLRGRHTR
ncbi:unnamed protein product, partial [Callosobruchus maculatus]